MEGPLYCCLTCTPGLSCSEINGNPCSDIFSSPTTPQCQALFESYCTTFDSTEELLLKWPSDGGGCWKAVRENAFGGPVSQGITGVCSLDPPRDYNYEGYFWSLDILQRVISRYAELGYRIGAPPSSSQYNIFQKRLYDNLCCPYPALCQGILEVSCQGVQGSDLTEGATVPGWCGCHMPAEAYDQYGGNYGVTKQCTPFCNMLGTVPTTDPSGKPVTCDQNVCIIDDTTIRLVSSQAGDIKIRQVCGECTGSCQCVIDDTNITAIDSSLSSSDITISNICGSFTCQVPSDDGKTTIPVDCSPSNISSVESQNRSYKYLYWLLLLFITFSIIVVALGMVYGLVRSSTKSKTTQASTEQLHNTASV